MMVRKQIVVPPDTDRRIRRLARQKGISQSAVVVEAIASLADAPEQVNHILAFAGIIDDTPANLSEDIDAVLYG